MFINITQHVKQVNIVLGPFLFSIEPNLRTLVCYDVVHANLTFYSVVELFSPTENYLRPSSVHFISVWQNRTMAIRA